MNYTLEEILEAWDSSYGENMTVEYPGFFEKLSKKEENKQDETIAWIVDLMHEHDYRLTDAKFFHTEEEARRFKDAISDPKFDSNGWVAVNCYSITTSNMQSAYDALQQYDNEDY